MGLGLIRKFIFSARTLPPRVLLERVLRYCRQKVKNLEGRRRDVLSSTYSRTQLSTGSLLCYFKPMAIDDLRPSIEKIRSLTDHYLNHRFDLLGSGWVQIKHNMHCRGLEGFTYQMGEPVNLDQQGHWLEGRINRSNLVEAKQIWRMLDKDYLPIDWHLDFKSGFRWSESTWYRDIQYGHKPGVDIKVPWELTRMQHLPQLAWAYALADAGQQGFSHPEMYLREFKCQILDFMATNPPRYGVNWFCSMDVGIRISNWLVAYDLFRAYGAKFDTEFDEVFSRSVYEHGVHLINNLEWYPGWRGNHYLCNIAGLLFVGAYLPRTPETDAWLAFGVQELINEVNHQFHPDGTNFEASTCYHRLAAETAAYATALVLGLPREKREALTEYNHLLHKASPALKPAAINFCHMLQDDVSIEFPGWYQERLQKMGEFAMHLTKPNGRIAQIGDNDSGRFLKLDSPYQRLTVAEAKSHYANLTNYHDLTDNAIFWDEDFLDHHHLVEAINALVKLKEFQEVSEIGGIETSVIRSLARGATFVSYRGFQGESAAEQVRFGGEGQKSRFIREFDSLPPESRQVIEIRVPGSDLCQGMKTYGYPDFGLYLFRSPRLYLAVRCGGPACGHGHNDQLAIELNLDGEDWILDRGTYLYTPLPEKRNAYRSVKAHFAPQISSGWEPGKLNEGLFQLEDKAKAEALCFDNSSFIGRHSGYGAEIRCYIRIESNIIMIFNMIHSKISLTLHRDHKFSKISNGHYVYHRNHLQTWSPAYGKECINSEVLSNKIAEA